MIHDTHVVMNHGQIVERGVTKTIWNCPQNPYTQRLVSLKSIQPQAPIEHKSEPLIHGKNITVHLQKNNFIFSKKNEPPQILKDICFSINSGETLGLVGESGSGKTTLAHAILKLIPFKGELYFRNQPVHTLTAKEFRHRRCALQMVFQDPYGSLNPRFTVYEILREGLSVHERDLSAIDEMNRINQAIKDVNMDVGDLTKYPYQFSGGQRQRIALARVLILKPQFIILDEPTSALDCIIQADILDLLTDLQKKYQLCYLLISHDLSVIKAMAHHIMVLKEGKIVEFGTTENIINHPQHYYTQQLIKAAFISLRTAVNHA